MWSIVCAEIGPISNIHILKISSYFIRFTVKKDWWVFRIRICEMSHESSGRIRRFKDFKEVSSNLGELLIKRETLYMLLKVQDQETVQFPIGK